jgi:hypothetical protein
MQLHKFVSDAPSNTISAEKLDENFRRLTPIKNSGSEQAYFINEGQDGWSFRVLPIPPSTGSYVLGCQGGGLLWIPTTECE